MIFQLGVPPARIDIVQNVSGVAFEDAWRNRVEGVLQGDIPVHVISRDDLITNKLATGRYIDLSGVDRLREAAEE